MKRSQSALEYMMTYGWAILIIVIVAVILYSMGIFNPSSSVTSTSSGFSPFAVSSVICNPAGLRIAIIAGGLPDSATSAEITGVYFSSNTGTTAVTGKLYKIAPVTVASGHSATIIVPTVNCTSSGTSISLSTKLQYSYSTPAGNVNTNTTGTIAGKSSSLTITNYVPLTITNTQSSATLSPFQQMVVVNMSKYSSYASSNLDNIEFTYPNGTIIPSWRENGTSNNQVVVYWLKLGSFTSLTVDMDFFSVGENVLNPVNTGEAPQLSSTYGEYDDGANIFNYYSNFVGTSLPSTFTSYLGPDTSLSVYNGLNIKDSNGCFFAGVIYNTPINSADSIVETYSSGIRGNGPEDVGIYTANSDYADGYAGVADTWGWGYGSIGGGYGNIGNPFSRSSGAGIASIYWIGQGNEGVGWNYDFVSSINGDETWSSSLYASIQTGNCSPNANMEYYWFRVRTYPPNGVMPSVSFGSIS